MCNLYRMTRAKDEIAGWFDAVDALGGANFGGEVYPGHPGAVIAGGHVRQMSWGFPLVVKGRNGQPMKPRPVNNARADKLSGGFWRASFAARRCLIPLTAWAEASGEKGRMTRNWLSRPDVALFAAAGVWRDSDEWGACYSMITTDAAGRAAEVHTRMPVLLREADWGRYTKGSAQEALALCVPWQGELTLERTLEPWSGRGQVGLL